MAKARSNTPKLYMQCPVDMREVARAHIQGALDDIRDGYVPEAITGLNLATNDLKAHLRKFKPTGK